MTKEQENALKIINEQCPSMSNGEEVCLSPTLFLEMYSTLKRLQEQVKELKDKQFTYCAYCGHKFPIDGSDSVVLVEEHIATCEKHPVFKLRAELKRLNRNIEMNLEHDVERTIAERKRIAEEVASFADDCLMGAALNELNRLAGNIARGDFIPNKSKEKS